MERLYNEISQFSPDLVIIDGWGWFVGHRASDPLMTTPAMAWLKNMRQSIGCATVIIHHFKKAQFTNRMLGQRDPGDELDQIEGVKRLVDQAQTALVYTPIEGYDTFNLLAGRTNKPEWDPPRMVIDYDHTTLTHKLVSRDEGAEYFDMETFKRLWEVSGESRWLKGAMNVICNRLGWNHAKFAEEFGVSRAAVSKWYSGKMNPSAEIMKRIQERYEEARHVPLKSAYMPRPAKEGE
jgi:transcriptional regulator with XRE-family HTH domain